MEKRWSEQHPQLVRWDDEPLSADDNEEELQPVGSQAEQDEQRAVDRLLLADL